MCTTCYAPWYHLQKVSGKYIKNLAISSPSIMNVHLILSLKIECIEMQHNCAWKSCILGDIFGMTFCNFLYGIDLLLGILLFHIFYKTNASVLEMLIEYTQHEHDLSLGMPASMIYHLMCYQ